MNKLDLSEIRLSSLSRPDSEKQPGYDWFPVLKQGMVLVLVGTIIGAGLAGVSARALSAVLFVGAFDFISFVSACGALAVIATLANWIPAQRASRIHPIVAMKAE